MIFEVSCRGKGALEFAPPTIQRWDDGSGQWQLASFRELQVVSGARILIHVHGYNSPVDSARRGYQDFSRKAAEFGCWWPHELHFYWPGGDKRLHYGAARATAYRASKVLGSLIKLLRQSEATIHLEAHSLGNQVALHSAEWGQAPDVMFALGAAVDADCLESTGEFSEAAQEIARLVVCHSERDGILEYFYHLGDKDNRARPLGWKGPRQTAGLPGSVVVVDVQGDVGSHGDYRRSGLVMEAVRRAMGVGQ